MPKQLATKIDTLNSMNARRRKLLRLQKELKRKQTNAKKGFFFRKVKNYFILTLVGISILMAGLQHYEWIDLRKAEYLGVMVDLIENTQATPATDLPQNTSGTSSKYSDDFFLPAHRKDDPMLVRHQYYTLHYNEAHEQANWVAYKLEAGYLQGDAKRPNNFRSDPKVATGSATPADYRNSGFDRGHMVPSGDFKFSAEAMSETFYMSNMSPQRNEFNGGIWHDLERQVRNWAAQKKTIYVIMGPVLEKGLPKIGANQVSVPKRYFKIVINDDPIHPQALAFLMANRNSYLEPENYTVTIDELEALTSIDFFAELDDEIEKALESQLNKNTWYD